MTTTQTTKTYRIELAMHRACDDRNGETRTSVYAVVARPEGHIERSFFERENAAKWIEQNPRA